MVDTTHRLNELWWALVRRRSIDDDKPAERNSFLLPTTQQAANLSRYYQEIAINRTMEAILSWRAAIAPHDGDWHGQDGRRLPDLLEALEADGTDRGTPQAASILYLADRNILVDDPKDKTFTPFGDARHKIEAGRSSRAGRCTSPSIRPLAEDERRAGLFREYPPDFFDLIIVDECHRGSARDDSTWRAILEYFKPAYQLGMTATPLRTTTATPTFISATRSTTYSLRQGIDDGFLAPYRVHRVITSGMLPVAADKDDLDRYGRPIPDDEYQTGDFERVGR